MTMHTINRMNENEWSVDSLERCSDGYDITIPKFQRLSCVTAMRVCSMLNGGNAIFTEMEYKVLAMCAVK